MLRIWRMFNNSWIGIEFYGVQEDTTSATQDRFSSNTPKSIIFGKFIQQSANTFPYASQMFKILNKPLSSLSKKK